VAPKEGKKNIKKKEEGVLPYLSPEARTRKGFKLPRKKGPTRHDSRPQSSFTGHNQYLSGGKKRIWQEKREDFESNNKGE